MASQKHSDNTSVPADASNPDANKLVVALMDGSEAFIGKYDNELHWSVAVLKGEAKGTLTYSQNFNSGDSAKFNAEVAGEDVTITFTGTGPRHGRSAATAEFKGKGYIRPGTGTGTWLIQVY